MSGSIWSGFQPHLFDPLMGAATVPQQPQLFDAGELIDRGEIERRCTAAPSGTGPEGETCKTCRHYTRVGNRNKHPKCGLMSHEWTHGAGTDIQAGWAACREWKAKDAGQ